MAFETYVPQRGRASSKSTIRILKSGDFSISPSVYDQWFGGAKNVELLYDPKAKKVGLRPRRKSDRMTYKLRESPQGGQRYYVSSGQFLDHYGVSHQKSRGFEAKWNARQKVVEFSVK
ncbi:MAG: hypothetical protein ACREMD_06485 [Gemmatimonadota bacterium]